MVKPVLIVSGIVVGMILVLFLSTSVIPKALVTLTKASSSEKLVISNSYLIGQKILARADGEDKCIVNVFLLDKNSRGVMGKSVEIEGMDNIKAVNALSDKSGKITFEMTSVEKKNFKIRANIGGSWLPQTIVVTFN